MPIPLLRSLSNQAMQSGPSILEDRLPDPCAIEEISGSVAFVYGAKGLDTPRWRTPGAREFVRAARRTYRVYGDVPLEDEYDRKSAVYLVRVVSSIAGLAGHSIPVEEWVTLRCVPAAGSPHGTEDLDLYACRATGESGGVPVAEVIRERGIQTAAGRRLVGADRIVSLARLGAIRPRALDASDEVSLQDGRVRGLIPTGNRHVALAFALILRQFLSDCQRDGQQVDLITAQMQPKIAARLLTKPWLPEPVLPLALASERLDARSGHVRLDRKASGMQAYRFPGYFLDLFDLVRVLRELRVRGLLSARCLERHLGSEIALERFLNSTPRPAWCTALGDLLTMCGPIPDATLTGEQLRAVLDEQVADAPALRLATTDELAAPVDRAIVVCAPQAGEEIEKGRTEGPVAAPRLL